MGLAPRPTAASSVTATDESRFTGRRLRTVRMMRDVGTVVAPVAVSTSTIW